MKNNKILVATFLLVALSSVAVGQNMASRIGSAMVQAYGRAGVPARFRCAGVDRDGARILPAEANAP